MLQGLCEEAAAAQRSEGSPEELRRLLEAASLAVVETLHQGVCVCVCVGIGLHRRLCTGLHLFD